MSPALPWVRRPCVNIIFSTVVRQRHGLLPLHMALSDWKKDITISRSSFMFANDDKINSDVFTA